jgi:hypothetical protein
VSWGNGEEAAPAPGPGFALAAGSGFLPDGAVPAAGVRVPVPAGVPAVGCWPGLATAAGLSVKGAAGLAGASPGQVRGAVTLGNSVAPGSDKPRAGPRTLALPDRGVVSERGGTKGPAVAGRSWAQPAPPPIRSSTMPTTTPDLQPLRWRQGRGGGAGAGLRFTDPAMTDTSPRRLISGQPSKGPSRPGLPLQTGSQGGCSRRVLRSC